MRWVPVLLALALVSCTTRAEWLLREAERLSFDGAYSEAAARYGLVLEAVGEDHSPEARATRIRAHLRRASILALHLDDPQEAIRDYRNALELGLAKREARAAGLGLVQIYRDRLVDAPAAATALSQLLPEDRPGDPLAAELVRLYLRARRYKDAASLAARRMEATSGVERFQATMRLALALELQGKVLEALELLKTQDSEALPKASQGQLRLAVARYYEKIGQPENALVVYRELKAERSTPLLEARIAVLDGSASASKAPEPKARSPKRPRRASSKRARIIVHRSPAANANRAGRKGSRPASDVSTQTASITKSH